MSTANSKTPKRVFKIAAGQDSRNLALEFVKLNLAAIGPGSVGDWTTTADSGTEEEARGRIDGWERGQLNTFKQIDSDDIVALALGYELVAIGRVHRGYKFVNGRRFGDWDLFHTLVVDWIALPPWGRANGRVDWCSLPKGDPAGMILESSDLKQEVMENPYGDPYYEYQGRVCEIQDGRLQNLMRRIDGLLEAQDVWSSNVKRPDLADRKCNNPTELPSFRSLSSKVKEPLLSVIDISDALLHRSRSEHEAVTFSSFPFWRHSAGSLSR